MKNNHYVVALKEKFLGFSVLHFSVDFDSKETAAGSKEKFQQ